MHHASSNAQFADVAVLCTICAPDASRLAASAMESRDMHDVMFKGARERAVSAPERTAVDTGWPIAAL